MMDTKNNHGPIGVLILDTKFPRGVGDIGNEASYDFPVILRTVEGASVERVVNQGDPTLLEPFMDAAKQLQAEGASAITTSCGFLALFQPQIAAELNIPVFFSSLIQIPLAYAMTQRRVGIITASGASLTERHFRAAEIGDHIPLAVRGVETKPEFYDWIFVQKETLDTDKITEEIFDTTQELLAEYPDIGSFVFECHNMAPYAPKVSEVTGLPIFDIISFAHWVRSLLVKRKYL